MNFRSVEGKSHSVDFSTALLQGLAPDGGLYVPESFPKLSGEFIRHIDQYNLREVGFEILHPFLTEIPETQLHQIIERSLNFPIPLIQLDKNIFLLELFHGPTLAFKDVGARFIAEALSFIFSRQQRDVTILVATSGDTGSAVAHGFFGIEHTTVYILYPSGKISRLQEQQMTTLGGNIHAIEVEGTFDDCQRLVKQALTDPAIAAKHSLTTANSINLGRLLPQIVYYACAFAQWQRRASYHNMHPTVIVPSGNFGNLTAAAYAKETGIPFTKFVAATNANDEVPKYFRSGVFAPQTSVQTFSNAMDVGNPSNISRLQFLYNGNIERMRKDIEAVSISDEETIDEIRKTYRKTGYTLDPHTAVGVAAARKRLSVQSEPMIVAATAHPAKFPETVRKATGVEVPLPSQLREAMNRKKRSEHISASYEEFLKLILG